MINCANSFMFMSRNWKFCTKTFWRRCHARFQLRLDDTCVLKKKKRNETKREQHSKTLPLISLSLSLRRNPSAESQRGFSGWRPGLHVPGPGPPHKAAAVHGVPPQPHAPAAVAVSAAAVHLVRGGRTISSFPKHYIFEGQCTLYIRD